MTVAVFFTMAAEAGRAESMVRETAQKMAIWKLLFKILSIVE